MIEKEIKRIKKESVTEQELTKFKQSKKSQVINRMKSNRSMASLLTYFEVVQGDWRLTFDELKNVEQITAEDVKRVANQYLKKKNRTVGEIIPEDK